MWITGSDTVEESRQGDATWWARWGWRRADEHPGNAKVHEASCRASEARISKIRPEERINESWRQLGLFIIAVSFHFLSVLMFKFRFPAARFINYHPVIQVLTNAWLFVSSDQLLLSISPIYWFFPSSRCIPFSCFLISPSTHNCVLFPSPFFPSFLHILFLPAYLWFR